LAPAAPEQRLEQQELLRMELQRQELPLQALQELLWEQGPA
jgi:hypothetical protein